MIGFFEESTGVRSVTRLCAFLLTLGVVLLFLVVSEIAVVVTYKRPDLGVKIVEFLVAGIGTMTGGVWAALRERN